jgi:preprotein translocase subunit YajC
VEELSGLAPFLIILVAFYLLIIRPSRTRQRQQLRLQASLEPGQEVMTTSGLIATISAVEHDEVLLEASPGVVVRWARPAIARVLPAKDGVDEGADASSAGDSEVEQRGETSEEPVARAD